MGRTGHALRRPVLRRGLTCPIDHASIRSREGSPVTGPADSATPAEAYPAGQPGTAAASGGHRPSGRSQDSSPQTVAILPFVNRSDDAGQAYFSDGIAEDLAAKVEQSKSVADATTIVDITRPITHVSPLIYISDNGGAFTPWQTQTAATNAWYAGFLWHTCGIFRS